MAFTLVGVTLSCPVLSFHSSCNCICHPLLPVALFHSLPTFLYNLSRRRLRTPSSLFQPPHRHPEQRNQSIMHLHIFTLFILFIIALHALPLEPRDNDAPGLSFVNGKFQITMFNDLHMGDSGKQKDDPREKGPWSDDATLSVIDSVLKTEPETDLVVLNGDLTSCEWLSESSVYGMLDKIMAPFIRLKMPFTATWGNHDWSATCNTRWMTEHMWRVGNKNPKRQLTFTMSSPMEGSQNEVGSSNYYIPLYGAGEDGRKVLKMVLWFFDSKGGHVYTGDGNTRRPAGGVVHPKVVDWFTRTRAALSAAHNNIPIPSLAFVHIPLPITKLHRDTGHRNPHTNPGIQREKLGVQGASKDGNAAALPFMQALVDTPGLLGVFSGHDHGVDWCMKWLTTPSTHGHGLNICFGRHTGYDGYGSYMRGGRRIIIHEGALGGDNAVDTWIRLEDGEVSGRVVLNSTFGVDWYKEVGVKYS